MLNSAINVTDFWPTYPNLLITEVETVKKKDSSVLLLW